MNRKNLAYVAVAASLAAFACGCRSHSYHSRAYVTEPVYVEPAYVEPA